MTPQAEKLKEFKDNLIQLSEGITKPDFVKSFQKILKIVLEVEKKLIAKIDKAISELKTDSGALNNATQATLGNLEAKHRESIDKALKSQSDGLNFLRDKAVRIKDFKNGRDGVDGVDGSKGKDADEEKIIQEVLNKVELPELEIDAINGLKETLEELKSRPIGRLGGGGFSKIHLEVHIIDNEAVGTGDGTTTAFTLANIPNPPISLKITVGGSELFLTDDWTLSGKTITFLTAPPNGAKIRGSYRK